MYVYRNRVDEILPQLRVTRGLQPQDIVYKVHKTIIYSTTVPHGRYGMKEWNQTATEEQSDYILSEATRIGYIERKYTYTINPLMYEQ